MGENLEIRKIERISPGIPFRWGYELTDNPFNFQRGVIELVELDIMDDHYLLYSTNKFTPERNLLFGVVDRDKPKEADRRLYKRIRRYAENLARDRGEGTIIIDLTERGKEHEKDNVCPI
jgi:hypothetical protein